MRTWVALLRGINVGGSHIVPMKDLKDLLADLGLEDAQTHIQSGNCVFRLPEKKAEKLAERIAKGIEARFGFRPSVLVLGREDLAAALAENPFPQGHDDPKTLHLFFLTERAANADFDALEALRKDSEAFQLKERVFYLYAPDGIGRSKLADKVEKCLGVPVTARNLRSAMKVLELAGSS